MLGRLVVGIIKGLVLGGLLGFGLVKLGFAVPGPIIAYLAAALAGVLIGLVAGKPIWARDAKIEAGMKAAVGAILGAGLMFIARRWLQVTLPFSVGELGGPEGTGTLGGLAITSLALVTAAIGGFYEADNTPGDPQAEKESAKTPPEPAKRFAAPTAKVDADEEPDSEPAKKRSKN